MDGRVGEIVIEQRSAGAIFILRPTSCCSRCDVAGGSSIYMRTAVQTKLQGTRSRLGQHSPADLSPLTPHFL